MKTRTGAPVGFFTSEARGLRWLSEADAVDIPEVWAATDDCLIIEWVEPTKPNSEIATEFGTSLAQLHRAGAERFGADEDGYIGLLPLPNKTADSWPEFFAVRRILPYLKLASDRERIAPEDATAVEDVVRKITEIAGPEEPPARLHGDLWTGNVIWNTERSAALIDPAAHGGHRETDLAMLALFGLPQLPRVMAAYQEEHPLADGWRDRQPLHQLFPLLVHACLFGGSYGHQAGEAARKFA